jgi:hypothetical protein
MTFSPGIPKAATISIGDMLDHCARIKPGDEVLILSHIDGLYGSDNVVDREAVSWIQSMVQARGANASILWIDEPGQAHSWRFPPVAKAAMSACNVLINHSFNLVTEEMIEFRKYISERKFRMVRNFATTAPLLCTAWAQTPYELVSEIRYQSSLPFKNGEAWQLTDDNGTHLEGIFMPPHDPNFPFYSARRHESGYYLPWPEWVHPPVFIGKTSGTFIFDSMLSWWSRFIGISPYFKKEIRLTIENDRINKIEGGDEAQALIRFLAAMKERIGNGVYNMEALHFGVHPQAFVAPHQCPNILHRRLIEHSHTSNIHIHIGNAPPNAIYPYWMHCTADIRTATLRVGKTLVHDRGYLTALDSPAVKAVADRYPGRPGLDPVPRSY